MPFMKATSASSVCRRVRITRPSSGRPRCIMIVSSERTSALDERIVVAPVERG